MNRREHLLRPTHHGWWILVPCALLCAVGLATLYAIQPASGEGPGDAPLSRHILYLVVGVLLMGATVMTSYQRLGHYAYLLYGVCLALLAALVIDRWINLPFVPVVRGSRRWIRAPGFQFQPSELVKIGYIIALAWYLRYRKNYRTFGGLVGPFVLTLVPMVMLKMQPDLGTTLMMLPVLFAMLFVAGARMRHLALIALVAVAALPLFWMKMEMYQRLRVTAVILQSPTVRAWLADHPRVWDRLGPRSAWHDDAKAREWRREVTEWEVRRGYQLVRSKAAVGSGGFVGNGWGQGTFIEYDFLPDKHND
ncbi:MAG: FtsW/RodA/SpoVE family cell cycle protein, partial [Phycisphaerae bacterium]|nr:FtsW/RodA/SpoVE family cell cycle protein [Phycisphaerae bacterium]